MDERQIAQIIQERDKLRGQNEQLWAIVNKQKELIKQLKSQCNLGDTADSTDDLIHQMGRESKSNNRPEPVDDGNSRLNIGGKIPAKVDPPSPFDLDQNQESNDMDSSKESLNNQLPEPQPLRLKQLGSQNNIDSEPEHKKSQLVGTPLNVTTMASRDKLFSKSLNSITEEIPAATSNLVNDLKHIEPLFVKSMKKATDSGSRIYYIFQLWSLGNTLCFIEKGQDDFEALRKALEHDRSDVPFLPEIRLYNLGATGNILQGWMKNVCNLYPDHQALIKFMNTSVIEQNDLRESFKKQGMLYKKGNYFGVWKARYYELDTATGNVYYSEQKNAEFTGSFSLKYAYCGLYTPQAGDKQDEEYPGFVVTEYRKGFFAKQPDLEPRNADGLPSGKVEFRHVFHVENIEERDHWLRCMSGVIARFRTDDRVAQYFFTLTTPPEPKAKSAKNSVATRPEVPKIDPKPNVSATAANFESIAASTSTPDQLSRGLTVKQKVSNLTINDDSKIAQRRNPSSGNVITPGAIIDDQTRCLQQDFPPSLVQELPLKPPGKPVADSGKKKNNFFRDLIKRNTDSSPKQKYNIFGSNLKEATELTRIAPNIDMPAIIYRCIEYLETKNHFCEEGIYRLSGASSVITALKTRFEEDGDCNLVESYTYYDPHAVAGLLKLFFRELSEPLFSNELRAELFKITEYESREDRIIAIKQLLPYLPRINYTCLRMLVAHLLRVVMSSDKNKMTVRNIAIVFSPTLGIPAGLFTLLLAEFPVIFAWKSDDPSRELLAQTAPTSRPSVAGYNNSTTSQKYEEDIPESNSEMIQALADQLGQEEGEEVLEGSEHQEKLRDLLK